MLRRPPILNEEQVLLQGASVKYTNYTDELASPDDMPPVTTRLVRQQPSLPSTNPFLHPATQLAPPACGSGGAGAPLVH